MKIRCCVLPAYDRTAPLADSPSATSLPQPWPHSLVADPFTVFRLDAPVLRRELDAIRERRRTRFERAGDRDRLYKITQRLSHLLYVTFAAPGSASQA
ncbi:MAG TPA: hypothetical protein VFC28_02160 [Opitutaceae bacterium]|nr:hypothetical protein [Opitutaceae bacterium]